ncbi:MAG: twin-arginine translocation signal domain-containing protein, partial [Longimicrobiales bacterium]
MTDPRKPTSRRSFLGNLGAAALAAGATPHLLAADDRRRVAERMARQYRSPNDQINLAVIG